MYSRRCALWIVLFAFCAGCSGSTGSTPIPGPSASPEPPGIAGHGTLAVIDVGNPNEKKIRLFRPNSDQQFAQLIVGGQLFRPNSLAFDHRGHLYIGIFDRHLFGKYIVVEFKVPQLEKVREIDDLPGWDHSSVAIDDRNDLYVNSPDALGGRIRIYKPNTDRKPYREIRNLAALTTMLPVKNTLWVAGHTFHGSWLEGYDLYPSPKVIFTHSLKGSDASRIAVNSAVDGNLAAAFVAVPLSLNRAVNVFSRKDGFQKRILDRRNLKAMASDNANTIYISESIPGRIHVCDWQHCSHYFATNSNDPVALAVDPRNRNLYVGNADPGNVQIYHPGNTHPFLTIAPSHFKPIGLAIEP